jgi:hypothetical protein
LLMLPWRAQRIRVVPAEKYRVAARVFIATDSQLRLRCRGWHATHLRAVERGVEERVDALHSPLVFLARLVCPVNASYFPA